MMSRAWLLLCIPACVLWNDDPYSENVRQLTDADGDGVTVAEGDCNDADPNTLPGVPDSCDGDDNDCDGAIDEDLPDTVWCQDLDGDGFGNIATQLRTCFPEDGWVQNCQDCDDSSREIHPDATESCNGVDDNCDGSVDPPDAIDTTQWHADQDNDGYGAQEVTTVSCDPPPGSVQDGTDCDDDADQTHPGAKEVCDDGQDNDCDGTPNGCTWAETQSLSTAVAAFIEGPDFDYEYVGYAIGIADASSDGVSDLIIFSSGALYGDDTAGALHLWYGAPSGTQAIEDAPAHIVGQPDLYLGASASGSPAVPWTDETSGAATLLVTSGGFASALDSAGVVLQVPSGLYGRYDVTAEDVFARGRSSTESFGSTLSLSSNLAADGVSFVIGAPFNSDSGAYSGAVYLCLPAAPDAVDAVATIHGNVDDFIGGAVPPSEDLDGDGVDDLVLGATAAGGPAVVVFRGPIRGSYVRADADAELGSSTIVPDAVATIPDIDEDGIRDLAIPGRDELALVPGTTTGAVTMEAATVASLVLDEAESVVVGYGLATGDPQADGTQDLAIGIPQLDGPADAGGAVEGGAVAVVPLDGRFAGSTYLSESAEALFYGPDRRGSVGFTVTFGDVNSDGFDDLAVSALGWSTGTAVDAGGVWFILGGGI